jgi:hypothetical protein
MRPNVIGLGDITMNGLPGRSTRQTSPHTLRATRERFTPLILDESKFNPVQCIRQYFFADISPHPDELIPVEPVMPYSIADPPGGGKPAAASGQARGA